MQQLARDIMTHSPEIIRPDDTIERAARLMRDGDYGVLPVVDSQGIDDSGLLVGIVTDRDIVIKGVAEGHDKSTPIRHCMTTDPEIAAPDTPLSQVLMVMTARQIRHLPIVEFGRLLGIVSLADLASSDLPDSDKAKALEALSANPNRRPQIGSAFDPS